MRILHVNKYLYRRGGAEAYMLDVAARQRDDGDVVEMFAMAHPENEPARLSDTFPSYLELEPPPSGARAKARAAQRMVWSPRARRGIDEAARRFRPDVAHVHNVYHQLSPSVIAGLRDRGVPVVMTLHDYKLVCPSYQMLAGGLPCNACVQGSTLGAVTRRCKGGSLGASALLAAESAVHRRLGAYDDVEVFICPSRFLSEQLVAGGWRSERVRVLGNPIDPSGLPREVAKRDVVVFAGRLSPEKGIDVAIRAMARVDAACLEIAGDGPARSALEHLAAEVAPGRVSFLGRLDRTATLELMASARATVLPARWHENQPIAVLESLASGVPVITTHLGGLPELVTDGVSGRIIRPDDVDALARAIDELATDPARSMQMGARGRSRVMARHGMDGHVAALTEIYQAAAASVPRAATVEL